MDCKDCTDNQKSTIEYLKKVNEELQAENNRINEVIPMLKKFRDDRDWMRFHTPENLAKSISIEAGELLELYQWSNDPVIEDVEKELADVLIYCYNLAIVLNVDPVEIMKRKISLNNIKYPVNIS